MTAETLPARTERARLWLLVAIAIILIGWALRATGAFMVPVVFSVFLALLVAPLDRWGKRKAPEKFGWLGHVAAMGAILAALLIFVGLIWVAAQQVVERFPDAGGDGSLLPDFAARVAEEAVQGEDGAASGAAEGDAGTGAEAGAAPGAAGTGDATVGAAEDTASVASGPGTGARRVFTQFDQAVSGAGTSLMGRAADFAATYAAQILGTAGKTLGAVVLVFFLTLIMLVEGPEWRQKLGNLLDGSAREGSMDSVGVIAQRLRRYLLARTVLGLLTAALYAGWLWIFGVDLLVVWALLAFLLNYVPTVGSMIAGGVVAVYVFVQKDMGTAFAVGAGIFVIEQVMGNYIDPRVQGRQVSLSSLVVLVTLLVWGWIWGIAGTILAVPVTISAMIICSHVPALRPVALMLSNARDFEALDQQTKGSDEPENSAPQQRKNREHAAR